MTHPPEPRPLILVVDDDPQVLRFVASVLVSQGIDVLAVDTGAAAVEAYRRHGAGLAFVLSDVQMPGLDGPAVLRALQALDPGVRCAFMSGDPGRYSAEQLLELGAAQVLHKPFASLDGLIETVRGAARGRDVRPGSAAGGL